MATRRYRIQLPPWMATLPTSIRFTTVLSGVQYRFWLRWNPRANADTGVWMLSIYKPDGTPIVLSLRVVLTDDLLRLFHHKPECPPGRLAVNRNDGSEADPGLRDLAGAVTLDYEVDE